MKRISYKKFLAMLGENAYRQDIPSIGCFELTPLCNLDCKMCYVHLQDPSVKERMLSGEEWIGILENAIGRGMISALLTGGEAMTHPDFWRIYMYLIDRGVSVRIKTNGVLLTERNIERFREYPPYMIDVSLYGCDSESYLAVTGSDVYEKVVANIHAAIDAGLHLRLMITPSSYMSPWTERIMELARSFGVQVMVNSLLVEPNDDTGRTKKDFGLQQEETDRIFQKRDELFPPNYMTPEEEQELYGNREKRADVSERGLYCNSGRTAFAINWDGTMSPCLNFPRDVLLSYPLRDGFDTAWRQINEGIKNYTVPEKCHTCACQTKCHYCPVQHSKTAARHECDPEICAFWTHYYKEQNERKTKP